MTSEERSEGVCDFPKEARRRKEAKYIYTTGGMHIHACMETNVRTRKHTDKRIHTHTCNIACVLHVCIHASSNSYA